MLYVCALWFLFSTASLSATVILSLFLGQFGNQLFQVAAAVALAREHGCDLYFPDFDDLGAPRLPIDLAKNYRALFHRIPNRISYARPYYTHYEPGFVYTPIPYQPHIAISGFFHSEKYFKKYRTLILDLFAAPQEIEEALRHDYSSLLENPHTVGIHVRTWYNDWKNYNHDYAFYKAFLPPDMEYYKKAIALFDPQTLFVVFSDHIGWCKQHFKEIDRNFVFIEGQDYLHDFYLLSKCKHVIVGSSSFSWWAAYLNQNPNKKVVCRRPFVQCDPNLDSQGLICEDWIAIDMPKIAPPPIFDETL
jgi:Glycosyl transferase family 11